MHVPDHYATLQVSRDADAAVIRAAYNALIQRYHPDKNTGSAEAVIRTRQINEAYFILSDEMLRAVHDSLVAEQNANTASTADQPSPEQPAPPESPHIQSSTSPAARSWWPQLWWIVSLIAIRATFGAGASTTGLADDIGRVLAYTAAPAFGAWIISVITGTKNALRLIANVALVGTTIAVISGTAVHLTIPALPKAKMDQESVVPAPPTSNTIQPSNDDFGNVAEEFIAKPGNSDLKSPDKRILFQELVNKVDNETGHTLSHWDLLSLARERMFVNDPQARANSDYERAYMELIASYPVLANDQQLQSDVVALRDQLVANGRPGDLALRDAVHSVLDRRARNKEVVVLPASAGIPEMVVQNPRPELVAEINKQQELANRDLDSEMQRCNNSWEASMAAIPNGVGADRSISIAQENSRERDRCYARARAANAK